MSESEATSAPLFSVVIPCYGAERFILTTLGSIFAQTEQDFEIVVVHDESPDGTLALLQAQTDPRLRIIDQKNEGECGARNRGIREARGRYVAFMDSDDAWLPHHLSLARRFFEQHEGVMWYGSQHVRIGEIGEADYLLREPTPRAQEDFGLVRWLLEGDARTRPSAVVARRDALAGDLFPMGVKMHGDSIGWVRMAQSYPIFGCSDEVTMLYRVWGGSASDNYLRAFASPENNALTIMGEMRDAGGCSQEMLLYFQEFGLFNWRQRLSAQRLTSWLPEIERRRSITGACLSLLLKMSIYAHTLLIRTTCWVLGRKFLFVKRKQARLIAEWRASQQV